MFRDFSVPQSINCARQLAKTNDFSDTPVRAKGRGIKVTKAIAQLNTSSIGESFTHKHIDRELQSITGKEDKYIINVLELLGEKNTVPFIARYRKEMTGGMDEEEIKEISDRFTYLENLEKRKQEVIRLIDEQGLLTEELRNNILKQTVLNRVEDLYRPFKQKKKTRATEAKRKGLGPFAERILLQEPMDVEAAAEEFVSEEVESVDAAVKGALDIIAEKISDEPKYRSYILKVVRDTADIVTAKKKNAEDTAFFFLAEIGRAHV